VYSSIGSTYGFPKPVSARKVKQFLPFEVSFTKKNNNSFRKLYFVALRNAELLNVQGRGQHHLSSPLPNGAGSIGIIYIGRLLLF
jgi:hypothetical protein